MELKYLAAAAAAAAAAFLVYRKTVTNKRLRVVRSLPLSRGERVFFFFFPIGGPLDASNPRHFRSKSPPLPSPQHTTRPIAVRARPRRETHQRGTSHPASSGGISRAPWGRRAHASCSNREAPMCARRVCVCSFRHRHRRGEGGDGRACGRQFSATFYSFPHASSPPRN